MRCRRIAADPAAAHRAVAFGLIVCADAPEPGGCPSEQPSTSDGGMVRQLVGQRPHRTTNGLVLGLMVAPDQAVRLWAILGTEPVSLCQPRWRADYGAAEKSPKGSAPASAPGQDRCDSGGTRRIASLTTCDNVRLAKAQ